MTEMSPEELQTRILVLKQEHREIDEILQELENSGNTDRFTIKRYKKKKLHLKDTILKLEDDLLPDIIA